LVEWLQDELNLRYDVPRKIAREWVECDRVLPLLDGLDEVKTEHRGSCVEAINSFRHSHGLLPLVITSRTADYDTLAKPLRLQGAILVQPLTRDQVNAYLADLGSAGEWVRAAIRDDSSLWELLDSPLLLNIVTVAYAGQPEAPPPMSGTVGERRDYLFGSYVDQMLRRRAAEHRASPERTVHWLSWLADQMRAHGQAVFYLEQLQLDWLPQRQRRQIQFCYEIVCGLSGAILGGLVGGLVCALVDGLVGGLVFAVICGLVGREVGKSAGLRFGRRATGLFGGLVFGLFGGLIVGWIGNSVFGLMAGLALGLFGGLYYGLITYSTKLISCVESVHWSWSRYREYLTFRLGEQIVGLIVGLVFGLVSGLVFGLVSGLVSGLLRGLVQGEIETTTVPNQGIRRSAFNGIRIGLAFGLVSGLVIGWLVAMVSGRLVGLLIGLAVGLAFGLLAAGRNGGVACLKHVILRLALICNHSTPWNYVRFLDHAASRLLLRKVGGGYTFVHRLLLEHFAARYVEPSTADVKPDKPAEYRVDCKLHDWSIARKRLR
jgi:hypothetical protein